MSSVARAPDRLPPLADLWAPGTDSSQSSSFDHRIDVVLTRATKVALFFIS